MGYLIFKLKNQEIALDVFQMTWAKVIKNAHKFRQDKSFSPWLMAITTNLVKDWFKTASNYSKLLKSYKVEGSLPNEEARVLPNLSFLKKQAQDVLQLKYIGGFNSKEIGEKLNLSESNVRKISSRALKEIKTHIQNGGSI